jgi:hypothetical protein
MIKKLAGCPVIQLSGYLVSRLSSYPVNWETGKPANRRTNRFVRILMALDAIRYPSSCLLPRDDEEIHAERRM